MSRALLLLWQSFFDICRFRRKPQDLPASNALLLLALGLYVVTGTSLALLKLDLATALLSGLVDATLLVLLNWSLMLSVRHPERWRQSTTALGGTSVIMGLFSIPLWYWLLQAEALQWDVGLPLILLMSLGVWNMGVLGHIFRNALGSGFGLGLLVAFMFSVISTTVSYNLFPQD